MAWGILSLACVDTRAEQTAACPVCYSQGRKHVEELGGGSLTLAGLAAFMHSLSKLVQHLPLERGKADLGSGGLLSPIPARLMMC